MERRTMDRQKLLKRLRKLEGTRPSAQGRKSAERVKEEKQDKQVASTAGKMARLG